MRQEKIPKRTKIDKRDFISVILPTYNRAHWLGDAIQSLLAQKTDDRFDYEILVIDNNSTDSTAKIALRFVQDGPPLLRFLHQPLPGDAPTRNYGITNASGNWLAFFDDDQLAESNWLFELHRAAHLLKARIVGGPVRLDLPSAKLKELGPICREALREIDYFDEFHVYNAKYLPGGGNALVARKVFEQIGLFDDSMTMGSSDTDFFRRAIEAGIVQWYTPFAAVRHRIPDNRLAPAYFRWNALSGAACNTAHFDSETKSVLALLVACLGRWGQALIVHLPLLLWAWLKGDKGGVLGRKTRFWRAEGYTRKTLKVVFPRLFPQKDFFDSLEFRKNLLIGNSATSQTTSDASKPDTKQKTTTSC